MTSFDDQRGSLVGGGGGSGRLRTIISGSLTVSSSSGVQGSGSVGSSSSLDDETVKMTIIPSIFTDEPIKEGIDNPALSIDTTAERDVIVSPL